MTFGQKPDLKRGVVVDFDQIYNEALSLAITPGFKYNNGAKLVAASRGTPMVSLIESLGISPLKKPDFTRNPLGICHATEAKGATAGRSSWRRALPFLWSAFRRVLVQRAPDWPRSFLRESSAH